MRISDWSSDVCSSDLIGRREVADQLRTQQKRADQRQGAVIVGVCILIAVAIIGFAAFKPIKEWWDLRAFNDIDMSGIGEIGRASCRERVCQYVSISVVAVTLKKQQKQTTEYHS